MKRSELITNNILLQELFNSSEAATILIDLSGKIVLANDQFAALTGYNTDETESKKHWNEFIVESDHDTFTGFISLLRVDPSALAEKVEIVFNSRSEGEKICYLGGRYISNFKLIALSIIDITDHRATEQALASAKEEAENSERLKTAFLANMSHEIRTPINSIIGFADLLKLAELPEEKKRLYLDQVVNGSNDLLLLIEKIISVARLDSGHVKISNREFNLNGKLRDLHEKFLEDLGLRQRSALEILFSPGIDKDEFIINGDSIRIIEVMSNLLENAIKFTEKGRIEFGYYHMEENSDESEESLLFFVKDSGTGIEKSKKKVIFDRFVKVIDKEETIYKGAGLGLSICKEVVALFGGKIWVESTKGNGSRFFFSYPLSKKKSHTGAMTPSGDTQKSTLDWSDKLVLIAEDIESNYFYVKEILSSTNIKILRARDGAEAVDLYKKSPEIDLVIMDILMPGMDGYEATKEIRKISPEIPVIAQSAFTFEGDMQNGLYAGCFNDYIMKPYTRKVLLAMVKKHFEMK